MIALNSAVLNSRPATPAASREPQKRQEPLHLSVNSRLANNGTGPPKANARAALATAAKPISAIFNRYPD